MLTIATFHDYEIWQMDGKTAFLNEKLTEDVFMAQPEGFENASRSWNLCFHEKVTQFGFSRSEDESCIYVKVSGSVVVFLVLYVDDILLIGNDISMLQSVKDWLGKYFSMKDLGDASYILSIKNYRDGSKRLMGLSQNTYLDKILKRFKMENSKKWNLPLHHGIKISKDLCLKTNEELDRISRVPSALTIGLIMFLVYGGEEELGVTGYCDASWQTNKDDSHSQSGWVFLLNGGAVTWKSSKQDTMAVSTCESEYIIAFKVEEGHVIVMHIQLEDNPADPFTKALAKSRHDEHARSIGLKDNIKF
ncbi:retrotransposon protein, putative, ty1-copia subclass [Tanacetum coccineum]